MLCYGMVIYLDSGRCKELWKGKHRGTDADSNNDLLRSCRSAPDNRLHRKTDADVTFHGERDGQPDPRVTPDVRQLMTDP